ncbi:MAG: 4Fe-4S dicluster domain-containing protein [Coriobacteriales bacterium]|nr:4Fe-4S dicluster domain-containing protein [Coriobacteriales bacterium]
MDYRIGLNRRDFVSATGLVVGLVSLGAVVKLLPADVHLIRPPGGQDEDGFVALCTRCDRCRSICPTQAIAPARLEDGLLAVRSPKLDFRLGWCTFCGRCAEVCPTGALPSYKAECFEFAGLPDEVFCKTQLKLGVAVINRDRCIAWAGPSVCTICSTKCPYQAITLDEYGRPLVDLDLCNGCGVCENLCPSSRLLSYQGGLRRGIEVSALETKGL